MFPDKITVKSLSGNNITYNIKRWSKHGKDRLYITEDRKHGKRDKHCFDLISKCWIDQHGEGIPMRGRIAKVLEIE